MEYSIGPSFNDHSLKDRIVFFFFFWRFEKFSLLSSFFLFFNGVCSRITWTFLGGDNFGKQFVDNEIIKYYVCPFVY